MPGLVDIGKRAGQALGAKLFTAANQMFVSSASGVATVLAAPTVSGQYLGFDGTNIAWGIPSGTAGVVSDVTHTQSDTNLSNVTGLLVPISASSTEIWFFEAYLMISATSTAPDLKLGWTVPASATMRWGTLGAASGVAGFVSATAASTTTAMLIESDTTSYGTGNFVSGITEAGFIYGGGTAGNVQLQFAQNTSSATDLKVVKGSMLRYRRIAA